MTLTVPDIPARQALAAPDATAMCRRPGSVDRQAVCFEKVRTPCIAIQIFQSTRSCGTGRVRHRGRAFPAFFVEPWEDFDPRGYNILFTWLCRKNDVQRRDRAEISGGPQAKKRRKVFGRALARLSDWRGMPRTKDRFDDNRHVGPAISKRMLTGWRYRHIARVADVSLAVMRQCPAGSGISILTQVSPTRGARLYTAVEQGRVIRIWRKTDRLNR
ncbi:hypothetical protein SAMN05444004_102101 [Jannaschia faecimaris]|uniref:Uncharacterized protein n=1 Tax=Jannaschia faecimaris TaxID=1244108 RepID=A0A1H3L6D2_9RHOB|nr:hypothetical protein SAMN05444004_102101 [Jannaschia faecimaris]